MNTTKLTSIAVIVAVITITACSTAKKNAVPTVSSPPPSTNTFPFAFPKTENGIYAPGDKELTAIREQYKEVTMDQLKEGHVIYTAGACIQCHGPMDIYKYGETQWKGIVEDMAQKARISDAQKEAVYKYVLAIKATQPKEVK